VQPTKRIRIRIKKRTPYSLIKQQHLLRKRIKKRGLSKVIPRENGGGEKKRKKKEKGKGATHPKMSAWSEGRKNKNQFAKSVDHQRLRKRKEGEKRQKKREKVNRLFPKLVAAD